MNLPNKITIGRMFLVPLFLAALLGGFLPADTSRIVALVIFIIASASDWLDGFLARRLNLTTNFGKLMDPIADKLLVCSALVAFVELGGISAWMVVVIISREFIVSGVRLLAAERGKVIAAGTWAKLKTVMQMLLIIAMLLLHESIIGTGGGPGVFETVTELLKWLTVVLTVVSAVEYIYKNIDVFKGGAKG